MIEVEILNSRQMFEREKNAFTARCLRHLLAEDFVNKEHLEVRRSDKE